MSREPGLAEVDDIRETAKFPDLYLFLTKRKLAIAGHFNLRHLE